MAKSTILVAEDNRRTAEALTSTLESAGYEVPAHARNSREAVDTTYQLMPDLVLMGAHLNGEFDGIEAGRIIRAAKDTPIIYIAERIDERTILRAALTGPSAFLLKPLRDSELLANVKMALTNDSTLQARVRVRRDLPPTRAGERFVENNGKPKGGTTKGSLKELAKCSVELENANTALRMVIQSIADHEKEVEAKVVQKLNIMVKPTLDQLKSMGLPEPALFLIKSIEFNLTSMFSTFGLNLMKQGHKLTPREIRICEMIRSGLSSKQMAKIMGISLQTIQVHRKNIRKKLALTKSKRNLAEYLKSTM